MSDHPLVSVLTPVHNGQPYLRECVDSILAQTHPQWEHVIVDNRSTDDTLSVARAFAERDPRIKAFSNESFLPIMENWTATARKISPASRYCMIVPADDWLAPNAVEKMVNLALRHPSVGIVGSLMHRGSRIESGGLPTDSSVFSGREVVRLYLQQRIFAIAPTGSLIRADLIRGRRSLFAPEYLHADLALFFELLEHADFGFVHEPLFYSRVHRDSVTAKIATRRQTLLRDWLFFLLRYGPRYFSAEELAALRSTFLKRYYRQLVRAAVTLRGREFFDFHQSALRQVGLQPGLADLIAAGASEILGAVRHPGRALDVLHRLRDRQGPIPDRDITAHV